MSVAARKAQDGEEDALAAAMRNCPAPVCDAPSLFAGAVPDGDALNAQAAAAAAASSVSRVMPASRRASAKVPVTIFDAFRSGIRAGRKTPDGLTCRAAGWIRSSISSVVGTISTMSKEDAAQVGRR